MRLVRITLTGRRINKSQLRELMQRVILSPRKPPDARVKAFLSRIVSETITRPVPPTALVNSSRNTRF